MLQLNTCLYTLNVKDIVYAWIYSVVIAGSHLVIVLRTSQRSEMF